MRDAVGAIRLSHNLSSFTCTTTKELPAFLLAIPRPECLHELRIQANLTPEQGEVLMRMAGLRSLTLDRPTWNVVDMLPRWTAVCGSSLTSLTLYASFLSLCPKTSF
jgi:hypothetical protein